MRVVLSTFVLGLSSFAYYNPSETDQEHCYNTAVSLATSITNDTALQYEIFGASYDACISTMTAEK